jgi:hypothetical protein
VHQRYRAAGYANINRAFVAFRLNNEYGPVTWLLKHADINLALDP